MRNLITVIGSSNIDLVVRTPYFPKPGETIIGHEFKSFAGGKGANQAVAAARLGGNVSFVARIGNDSYGSDMLHGFQKDSVGVEHIFTDEEVASGVAVIIVDGNGQNSIVVSAGANGKLSPENILQALEAIEQAEIVLIQLEIPLETVEKVLEVGDKMGKKVILNPAPATALKLELYKQLFLITPNETEATLLTGIAVKDIYTAETAADVLLARGVKNVIITLGEKGAFFKNHEEKFHIPAQKVKVIDTTAAGDIFNGALTVALSENKDWREAILFANSASAIGVSRMGAQSSAPFRHELLISS